MCFDKFVCHRITIYQHLYCLLFWIRLIYYPFVETISETGFYKTWLRDPVILKEKTFQLLSHVRCKHWQLRWLYESQIDSYDYHHPWEWHLSWIRWLIVCHNHRQLSLKDPTSNIERKSTTCNKYDFTSRHTLDWVIKIYVFTSYYSVTILNNLMTRTW